MTLEERVKELERRVDLLLKANPMVALGMGLGSAELFPKEPEEEAKDE